MNLQPSPRRPSYAEDARVVSAGGNARVLRNTYALLALSMIPTVLGAWIGLATGLSTVLSGGLGLVVCGFGSSVLKNGTNVLL